jgi:hypothetical protein
MTGTGRTEDDIGKLASLVLSQVDNLKNSDTKIPNGHQSEKNGRLVSKKLLDEIEGNIKNQDLFISA